MLKCNHCNGTGPIYLRERAYVETLIGEDGNPKYKEDLKSGDDVFYDEDSNDLEYFCTSCGYSDESSEKVFTVLENSVDFITKGE